MSEPLEVLKALIEETHFLVPDALPVVIDEHARQIGASSAVVYLADLDQRWLVPLPRGSGDSIEAVAIDRTLAGTCFRSVAPVDTVEDSGDRCFWIPVVDGTQRLGVLQLLYATSTVQIEVMTAFAGLVAELIMTKRAYGDFFEITRRRRPITIASEQLWQLLPPLTFATDELVIAGAFTPTSDLGGDAFDYGVDLQHAYVGIFDAMGHGLGAGLLVTAAVAAYRNSRRTGLELAETAKRIGTTIDDHFGDHQYVTGVLTSLDIATGQLSWCLAGHPRPLLVRRGQVVKQLDPRNGMPFGVGPPSSVLQEQLEPGDRVLLYTDGVTEARDVNGEFFGVEQLVDLVTRTAGDDPPPEAMRRLMHAVEDHNDGPMRDDATVVLIEWQGAGGSILEL